MNICNFMFCINFSHLKSFFKILAIRKISLLLYNYSIMTSTKLSFKSIFIPASFPRVSAHFLANSQVSFSFPFYLHTLIFYFYERTLTLLHHQYKQNLMQSIFLFLSTDCESFIFSFIYILFLFFLAIVAVLFFSRDGQFCFFVFCKIYVTLNNLLSNWIIFYRTNSFQL